MATDPAPAPVVRFDHVDMRYGQTVEAAVLDFTLTVPAGTITVLLGSSGCGKTTLLRMVNRMVTPTAGRVLIDGQDVTERPAVALRRATGYVMQDAGLLPHRRVLDNIITVPRLNGERPVSARRRGLGLMDLVGLDRNLARRWPAELSGGQRQRVGVARALAGDPALLLMDEPFAAVDPIVRADLQRDLASLQARLHKTILFVTHDVAEALRLGDQIVLLRTGARIVQQGTPEELLTHPADDFVRSFIGLDRGTTALHVQQLDDAKLVLDATGRPLGRLSGSSVDGPSW